MQDAASRRPEGKKQPKKRRPEVGGCGKKFGGPGSKHPKVPRCQSKPRVTCRIYTFNLDKHLTSDPAAAWSTFKESHSRAFTQLPTKVEPGGFEVCHLPSARIPSPHQSIPLRLARFTSSPKTPAMYGQDSRHTATRQGLHIGTSWHLACAHSTN